MHEFEALKQPSFRSNKAMIIVALAAVAAIAAITMVQVVGRVKRTEAMEYALVPVGFRQRNMVRFMPMMSVAEYNGPLTVHTNINNVKTAGTYDTPGSDYNGPLTIHTNQYNVKTAGTYETPSSGWNGPLTVFNGGKTGTFDRS